MADSIFRAYDIRGVYGEQLDEGLAYLIGRAVVSFTEANRILVGRDMRESSPKLRDALVRGMMDQGADVVDIGLTSTPMFYWATQNYDAGVMVTASHNPAKYNGFKICMQGATPVGGNNGMQDVEKLVLEQNFPEPQRKGESSEQDVLDDFINYNIKFLKTEKNFKVVVDAGNGMSGYTYKALQEKIPPNIELIPMFFELDGSFPNREPNPIAPNALVKLQKKVLEVGADLGIALDGDGDRIIFIDDKGRYIRNDIMLAIIAKQVLREKPGATILYDIRSSWVVKEEVESAGGTAKVTRVGHAFIKVDMKVYNALFAGELSGHFYNAVQQPMENTQMVFFWVLNLLAENGKLSIMADQLQSRYYKIEETNFKVSDPQAAVKVVAEKYAEIQGVTQSSTVDGVRVDFHDWWFNVRPSNTEPYLRLNLEAKTEELQKEKFAELKHVIESLE